MAIDVTAINFFMPVFSFFFVFLVLYAILFKTNVLGADKWIYILISFIMAIVFMSFSSMELYVKTILPWFAVLIVIVFLVLVIAAFSTKDLGLIAKPAFGWFFVIVLAIIFLVAAIKVFNPVFHPDLIITSADGQPGVMAQIESFFVSSRWAGSILLIIITAIVAFVITR